MVNKRGWMRILEATISILLISSVLLVVYSKQVERKDLNAEMFRLQKQVLMDITSRSDLREAVLRSNRSTIAGEGNFSIVNNYTDLKIPDNYKYSLRICELGDICKLESAVVTDNPELIKAGAIYSEEVVVSADFKGYSPKKVKLYVWEARTN